MPFNVQYQCKGPLTTTAGGGAVLFNSGENLSLHRLQHRLQHRRAKGGPHLFLHVAPTLAASATANQREIDFPIPNPSRDAHEPAMPEEKSDGLRRLAHLVFVKL